MARTVPTAFATALTDPHISAYHAVELLFDSGALRLWTGFGNRTINGQVYTGTGSLMQFSNAEESADLSAKTAEVTLSGLNSSLVALALAEPYQGRWARLFVGITTITDVVEIFSGEMNTMDIFDSGETATIKLSIDSKLIQLEKTPALRYTQESQEALYPGDTFFAFVAGLADQTIQFGGKS